MSETRVPVTVVLGWSESAKSDALRRIGGDEPSTLAVVCPEPTQPPQGARVIRGVERVAEQSLGCACCALRLDVRTAVFRRLAQRRPPAHIAVVAGAEADPGPLLATLLCDLHMVRRTVLDEAVTAVDGREAAVRLATNQALAPGARALEHLVVADGVVVVGAAHLTEGARTGIGLAVGRISPFEPRWATDDESWPSPGREPDGSVYALAGVASRLDGLDSSLIDSSLIDSSLIDSSLIDSSLIDSSRAVLLDIEGEADPDALREWVTRVCGTQGERLLRLQAVCSLRSRTDRWACSAVRSFYATGWCDRSVAGPPRARVLAVGRDLDVDALAGSLRSALTSA